VECVAFESTGRNAIVVSADGREGVVRRGWRGTAGHAEVSYTAEQGAEKRAGAA
jgi:hypothetical protein